MPNTPQNEIRVLVVDDSAFMRKVVSDILNSDDEIKVVDIAKNGIEALEKVKILKPDVITLDVEMPAMDGLSCLKQLLKDEYVSVVMLSSITKEGAEATIQALEYGAVDFITKPTNIFDISGEDKKKEIIGKIKIAKFAARFKKTVVKTVPDAIEKKPRADIGKSNILKHVVAIGTSTGGPKALQSVVPAFPGDIPAAVLIVQHMPPGFTKSLAERLNSMSELTVKEAEDRETVKAGFAYIAPGDYHMLLERFEGSNLRIRLSHDPPVGGHRPAVNVMMESLSNTGLKNIIGVIMTGMGGDGGEGMKLLKSINNAYTIAQDEESCVVYGMPKVAVQTGAIDKVVPLKSITSQIMKFIGGINNGYESIP